MHDYRLAIIPAILAITITVVRAGGFLLSRDQQKSLQSFMDDLALRLSYLGGLERINSYVRGHKPQFTGVIIAISCLVLWPRIFWGYAPRWSFVVFIGLGSLFSTLTLTWTIGAGTTYRRLVRGAVAFGAPVVIGVVLTFMQRPFIVPAGSKLAPLALENLVAYAIAASLAAATVPVLGLVLWLTTMSICAVVLKVGTIAVWRIAEYTKGALAGLMALLIVVLTILVVLVNGKSR
jgi:hypothetical protein